MDALLQDVRYAARMLRKHKGFTALAVVSLAVGIAANTAVFSVVNAVLLRARPVANPDELVVLYKGTPTHPFETTSYPSYLDLRAQGGAFGGVAAYGIQQFRIGEGETLEQVWGEGVSGNYFTVLGVVPASGRGFIAEEDSVPGRNPVVIVSHSLWQRRFASDPALVGRVIQVNGQPLTVVGVAPRDFLGMMGGLASDLWVPAVMMPALDPSRGPGMVSSYGSNWVTIIGRLASGASIVQAQAQADRYAALMQDEPSDEWRREDGRQTVLTVLPERAARIHPGLQTAAFAGAGLLIVAVNLVLLIACINLTGLLVARAVSRRGEIGVRLALGAGRLRIARQLMTESMVLGLIAGMVGVVLGVWALDTLVALMPPLPEGLRIAVDAGVDWRVLAFSCAVAGTVGLAFGLAPAVYAMRTDIASILKDAATAGAVRRSSRMRASLVVAQVAVSLPLLIGAGLVLRSLDNVRPSALGYASEQMVVAPLSLDESRYDDAALRHFYEQLSTRVAAMPGVTATSLFEGIPGGFMSRVRRGVGIEGSTAGPGETMEIDAALVGPRYFTNMGMPIVEGRDFETRDRDGAPCVAIVNEAFARTYFSDAGSPLGRRLVRGSGASMRTCEIVGVVRDAALQSLNADVRPFFALSVLQSPEHRMTLLVHTAGPPGPSLAPVRQVIHEMDGQIPTGDVRTLGDHFAVTSFPFRALGFVLAVSGLLALILATIGIYGIVAHSVAERRRELGLRVALGAMERDILRVVVVGGMRLVGIGTAIGLALGVVLTRALTSGVFGTGLLFGVGATDALTFTAVTALLALVALAACLVPARRAARVDPMVSLRGT